MILVQLPYGPREECLAAIEGFERCGGDTSDVIVATGPLLSQGDIEMVEFAVQTQKLQLAVGSVQFMQQLFGLLQLNPQMYTLPYNNYAPIVITTLGEALAGAAKHPVFVKPRPDSPKLFTGKVVDGATYGDLERLPADTLVQISSPWPADPVTEWRVFVYQGAAVGTRVYAGVEQELDPDFRDRAVEDAMCSLRPLAAFSVDIALLENGQYVVVEYNDFWSLGSYGLDAVQYYRAARARFQQIIYSEPQEEATTEDTPPVECPSCGSESISGGAFDYELGFVSQVVGCAECGAEWRDEYTYTHTEML